MKAAIPTRVVPSARPSPYEGRRIEREFHRRLDAGMEIRAAGEAKRDPLGLLARGYTPKHKIELFDTSYYLTNVRQNQDIRFFVAYVLPPSQDGPGCAHPNVFYKDVSLIWRTASHFVSSDQENWIGKGDLKTVRENGRLVEYADESTTDLPLEIQTALETLSRKVRRIRQDEIALRLVLHRGPSDRLAPYRDFTEPRRRAWANPRNRINAGRRIAFFSRRNDPSSLRFVAGFEPDLGSGVLEVSGSTSKLYGGRLKRYRILSRNRRIQYLFMAGPRHVWIVPPQATTTEIMSYGVRTVDVHADEHLFTPGFEYHFVQDGHNGPELVSQIPEGHAGEPNPLDASRADASPWLERIPIVQEFRRRVLERDRGRRRRAR